MWEYKIETIPYHNISSIQEGYLNEIGKDGWELVAIEPKYLGYDSDFQRYTFKRRLDWDRPKLVLTMPLNEYQD